MTSNPRFAQYVERVQQYLAVFSIPDRRAKTFLRRSDAIAEYNPSFLVFEILINDRSKSSSPVRMFDPHVSSELLESFTVETALSNLKRLYLNTQHLRKIGKPIDWHHINWTLSEDKENEFADFGREITELFEIYDRLGRNCEQPEDGLNNLESLMPEVDVEEHRSDLEKVVSTLKKLVRRYEREYIPTNLAASALIYEAWRTGNLQPFGNPEENENKFDSLLNALFVCVAEGSTEGPLPKMAEDIGVPYLKALGKSQLNSGDVWEKVPSQPWFTCVENSLIYKQLLDTEAPRDTYVIHFPLVLDNYRFVGFCYLHTAIEKERELSDIFIRDKYPKFYHAIQTVSETLRFSLRADALDRVNRCLEEGQRDPEVIFAEAVKDYVVCFDVIRENNSSISEVKRDSLNQNLLYEGHGLKIYGPEWVTDKHKKTLSDELDGSSEQMAFYAIPGLYQDMELRIERFQREREQGEAEGQENQAGIFSHQAAGLVSEVWCDKGMAKLTPQSQGCLWQLKTLIDIWGNFDLEPNATLAEGPQDYPQFWFGLSREDLLNELVNVGIVHALRRSTYRRSGAENPRFDEIARSKALEVRSSPQRMMLFKDWTGLEILNRQAAYPDWMSYRGFVLCFHHCFWQAAFHGFRARCSTDEGIFSSQTSSSCFVRVEIDADSVTISNRKMADRSSNDDASSTPRDIGFYEGNLLKRIDDSFHIEGPAPVSESSEDWQAVISPS